MDEPGPANRTRSDINMVRRAVREGWPIPTEKRGDVTGRLLKIIDKQAVSILTEDGVVEVEDRADTNAIAAARVVVQMDSINQTDYWNYDKNERLDAGKPTERVGGVEIDIPGLNRLTETSN